MLLRERIPRKADVAGMERMEERGDCEVVEVTTVEMDSVHEQEKDRVVMVVVVICAASAVVSLPAQLSHLAAHPRTQPN